MGRDSDTNFVSNGRAESLVSVVIASRNRPDELARTLADLALQDYHPLEVVVVDDASDQSLEATVRHHWPDAVFVRRRVCTGQCDCRNYAFTLAKGKYLLQLDDDASLTRRDGISKTVHAMDEHPEVGV